MAFRVFGKEFTLTNSSAELSLGLGTNEALLVSSATAVNSDSVTRTVTMNLASDGSVAALGNRIEYLRTLSVNTSTNTALSGKTIKPGGKLYANADANSVVTLQISGTIIPQS